jgi:hypothetical protein
VVLVCLVVLGVSVYFGYDRATTETYQTVLGRYDPTAKTSVQVIPPTFAYKSYVPYSFDAAFPNRTWLVDSVLRNAISQFRTADDCVQTFPENSFYPASLYVNMKVSLFATTELQFRFIPSSYDMAFTIFRDDTDRLNQTVLDSYLNYCGLNMTQLCEWKGDTFTPQDYIDNGWNTLNYFWNTDRGNVVFFYCDVGVFEVQTSEVLAPSATVRPMMVSFLTCANGQLDLAWRYLNLSQWCKEKWLPTDGSRFLNTYANKSSLTSVIAQAASVLSLGFLIGRMFTHTVRPCCGDTSDKKTEDTLNASDRELVPVASSDPAPRASTASLPDG